MGGGEIISAIMFILMGLVFFIGICVRFFFVYPVIERFVCLFFFLSLVLFFFSCPVLIKKKKTHTEDYFTQTKCGQQFQLFFVLVVLLSFLSLFIRNDKSSKNKYFFFSTFSFIQSPLFCFQQGEKASTSQKHQKTFGHFYMVLSSTIIS